MFISVVDISPNVQIAASLKEAANISHDEQNRFLHQNLMPEVQLPQCVVLNEQLPCFTEKRLSNCTENGCRFPHQRPLVTDENWLPADF